MGLSDKKNINYFNFADVKDHVQEAVYPLEVYFFLSQKVMM